MPNKCPKTEVLNSIFSQFSLHITEISNKNLLVIEFSSTRKSSTFTQFYNVYVANDLV